MRHFLWVFAAALALAICPAYAGNLQLSEMSIDYGTIKEGPPVVKKILLTNTGDVPLEIVNVAAS